MYCRVCRNTKINRPAAQIHVQTAILRRTRFSDIQTTDHLKPDRYATPVTFMQAANLLQYAIDSIAYAQERLFRFKVNIRSATFYRVHQQRTHQAYHRLRILIAIRTQALVINLAGFNFTQNAINRKLIAVKLVDVLLQLRFRCQYRPKLDLATQHGTQLIQRYHIEQVSHGNHHGAGCFFKSNRQQMITAGKILRHHLQCINIGNHGRQIDTFRTNRTGEGIAHHRLGNKTQTHELTPQRQIIVFLLYERDA